MNDELDGIGEIFLSERLQGILDRTIALMQTDGTDAQMLEVERNSAMLCKHFLPLIKELCAAGLLSVSLVLDRQEEAKIGEFATLNCFNQTRAFLFGEHDTTIVLTGDWDGTGLSHDEFAG